MERPTIMIGKLKGIVDSCFDDHAIIDVSGVGYRVYCSAGALHKLAPGEFCQLFIETHVREDHIKLYGFQSLEEKDYFNLLLSVNGIGTRMGLSILSHMSPQEIGLAISCKDKEAFRAVSGVGLKLAERIIIELKGKIINNLGLHNTDLTQHFKVPEIVADAVSALTNLGIVKIEAQKSVESIFVKDNQISLDELIKLALKTRGKNV
jgi:Holliday junction DNA helicase RuvA